MLYELMRRFNELYTVLKTTLDTLEHSKLLLEKMDYIIRLLTLSGILNNTMENNKENSTLFQ